MRWELTGPLPLRRREGGFPALLKTICSQQLSVASADAVWNRLDAAGATVPANLVAMDETALRACGLSGQKIRYARALAEAEIDYRGLVELPEDEAIARLTAIKGIGVWTAEIYLMFSVGRPTCWRPATWRCRRRRGCCSISPGGPGTAICASWPPRGRPGARVAARILWAYYRVRKQREGISE